MSRCGKAMSIAEISLMDCGSRGRLRASGRLHRFAQLLAFDLTRCLHWLVTEVALARLARAQARN
jgi:hypothetical protein